MAFVKKALELVTPHLCVRECVLAYLITEPALKQYLETGIITSHYILILFFFFSTDTGFGTIYVSDDRGTVYSKSLERHLYTTTGGDTDFTNVTSLRGVFITSVLAEGRSVLTLFYLNFLR